MAGCGAEPTESPPVVLARVDSSRSKQDAPALRLDAVGVYSRQNLHYEGQSHGDAQGQVHWPTGAGGTHEDSRAEVRRHLCPEPGVHAPGSREGAKGPGPGLQAGGRALGHGRRNQPPHRPGRAVVLPTRSLRARHPAGHGRAGLRGALRHAAQGLRDQGPVRVGLPAAHPHQRRPRPGPHRLHRLGQAAQPDA